MDDQGDTLGATHDKATIVPGPQVLQQNSQSPQFSLTKPPRKQQRPSDTHQGQRTEFGLMWDAIDGFIDATRSRKNSMKPSKPTIIESPQVSFASQARPGTPRQLHHGRTVSQVAGLAQGPSSPIVPPRSETPVATTSRKGELKSSFKGMIRSRLTEKLIHSDLHKPKPLESPARNDSLKRTASYRSHVRKESISSPIPLDPYSLLPQYIDQTERDTFARAGQPLSTSGTLKPIAGKQKFAVQQERDIQATLQPSPKHVVQFAESQVPQRSVQAITDMPSQTSRRDDKSIRLQANRRTRNARTTRFGDFMNASLPEEKEEPMPLRTNEAFEKLNRRSTLRTQQDPSTIEQPDISTPAIVGNPLPDKPTTEARGIQPARNHIKSEWFAAATACVHSMPLDFEPCRSCELPFNGGSDTQKTCKGQLCGDCIVKQPKCLYCGKVPFSAKSEVTQHGIWCEKCADCLPYPCHFCGKELARKFQKKTDSGLMCWECAGAKTPQEIAPQEIAAKDWPRSRSNSEERAPTPPPKSPEYWQPETSKPLPPEPLMAGRQDAKRWPERNTSLTPVPRQQISSKSKGVAASISPTVLKRDHSPLSRLEQDLGVETHQEDQDAMSEVSEHWGTDMSDMISDDETVGPLSDYAKQKKRETFALLPFPRAQSPFTPDLGRVASSIYPEDERSVLDLADAPPLPPMPAAYRPQNADAYGIPATPYEEEQRSQSKAGLMRYNTSNAAKHSTLLDIVNCYLVSLDEEGAAS